MTTSKTIHVFKHVFLLYFFLGVHVKTQIAMSWNAPSSPGRVLLFLKCMCICRNSTDKEFSFTVSVIKEGKVLLLNFCWSHSRGKKSLPMKRNDKSSYAFF